MNKSTVMKNAHIKMRYSNFTASWSQCLKDAWKEEKLRMKRRQELIETLKEDACCFMYLKIDKSTGEVTERVAIGTLSKELFSYKSKSTKKRKENVELVKYFDLEKNAFRCFKLNHFVEFSDKYKIAA